jgi:hypothetical protein
MPPGVVGDTDGFLGLGSRNSIHTPSLALAQRGEGTPKRAARTWTRILGCLADVRPPKRWVGGRLWVHLCAI